MAQAHIEDSGSFYTDFSQVNCNECPFYENCPVKGKKKRQITWDKQKQAVDKRRKEVNTKEFKDKYKRRSGIEATNSELKNKHGKVRVVGHDRIEFSLIMKTVAMNIKRMIQSVLKKSSQNKENSESSACENNAESLFFILYFLFLPFISLLWSKIDKFFTNNKKSRFLFSTFIYALIFFISVKFLK